MPVLRLPGFQVWGTPTDGLSICLHLIRNQGRMGLLNPAICLLAFKHLHVFFISSLSIFGLLYVSINFQKKHFLVSNAYLFKKVFFLLSP